MIRVPHAGIDERYRRYRRRYLGQLCRLVDGLLKTGFKAMDPYGQSAFIFYLLTFGDLVTFNPHIHALVADGVILPSATLRYCEHCPRWRSLPSAKLTNASFQQLAILFIICWCY